MIAVILPSDSVVAVSSLMTMAALIIWRLGPDASVHFPLFTNCHLVQQKQTRVRQE